MKRISPLKTKLKPAGRLIAVLTLAGMLWGGLGGFVPPGHALSQPALPAAHAEQPPSPEAPNPPWPHEISDLDPDPALVFGRLGNRFRYVLMPNNRPQDRVSIHLFVRAGSLNETDAQQGIAHFLEHMLFNGSTHFPPGELVRYFQSIGMQFGNDVNARTGFDQTVYDIILPNGDEENLRKALLVMRDYAMGALLLEEEVDRERGVILAEKRSRDSADYRTFKATLGFELPDHLVSERLPIGKASVIKQADRELIKAFYDTWYRPDNTVLVMVGEFSIPLAERLIEAQFSSFAPRSEPPAPPEFSQFRHEGVNPFYHHEPEAGATAVSIKVIRPHDPAPDSLALRHRQLIEDMGNRVVQHRLDTLLRAPGAPFTAAAIGSGIYLNRIRYAAISADSSAENWEETLAILEQELRRARLHGFTEAEVDRVKQEVVRRLENAVREAPTRNSTTIASSIIRNLAGDRVIQSPEQEMSNLLSVVESATVTQLLQVFEENWFDDHRLVLVTGNADLESGSPLAPQELIRRSVLASADRAVDPIADPVIVAFPYLPDPPANGAITSHEVLEDLGITRVQFENGFTLNLKPTDFQTNEVLANLIFGHGQSAEPKPLPGISLLAETTVNESGLGAMDSDSLRRALSGKSTRVHFGITETHFNFFGKTVSDEVALLFQLLYAHVTDPGFRPESLTLARERLRQDYESSTRSIEGMMKIQGARLLAGGDNRFGMPALEKTAAIGLDDIRDWIIPQLHAGPLELSIVGDFDLDEAIDLASRTLGALPQHSGDATPARADLPHLPVGTIHTIDVATQISKAMVVAAWRTEDFWDISRTRRLSVLSDLFSNRLREQIREKLGVAYSPFAFNRSSRAYPGYGVLQARITVDPEQSSTLLAEIKAIAADLADNGVSADELMRAVDPTLTAITTLRRTNGYWLNSVMTGSQRHPQQFEWARSFVDDYSAVTVAEVAALAAAYLNDERAAAVIIQPRSETP